MQYKGEEMDINFRTLNPDEIEVRVDRFTPKFNPTALTLLLYKNARVDMDLLDETVGPLNWKREHSRDNFNCTISVYDSNKKEWVSKEDTGVEGNFEKEKSRASDSFKRAGVNWGIGRELYSAPTISFDLANTNAYENNNTWNCWDKFKVADIGYDENNDIDYLVIVNTSKIDSKTKKLCTFYYATYERLAKTQKEYEIGVDDILEVYDVKDFSVLGTEHFGWICSPEGIEYFKKKKERTENTPIEEQPKDDEALVDVADGAEVNNGIPFK